MADAASNPQSTAGAVAQPAAQPASVPDVKMADVDQDMDEEEKKEDAEALRPGAEGAQKGGAVKGEKSSGTRRVDFPDLPAQEPKIPLKKDSTLREFLGKMDDYAPIIPDAVIDYYLTMAGLPPPPQTPQHLARLLALATQKFVADIATDAYQYARIRTSNASSNNPMNMIGGAAAGAAGAGGAAGAAGGTSKESGGAAAKGANLGVQRPGFGGGGQGSAQGRAVLTMEDLGMAAGEYGVNLKRGEFYR